MNNSSTSCLLDWFHNTTDRPDEKAGPDHLAAVAGDAVAMGWSGKDLPTPSGAACLATLSRSARHVRAGIRAGRLAGRRPFGR